MSNAPALCCAVCRRIVSGETASLQRVGSQYLCGACAAPKPSILAKLGHWFGQWSAREWRAFAMRALIALAAGAIAGAASFALMFYVGLWVGTIVMGALDKSANVIAYVLAFLMALLVVSAAMQVITVVAVMVGLVTAVLVWQRSGRRSWWRSAG